MNDSEIYKHDIEPLIGLHNCRMQIDLVELTKTMGIPKERMIETFNEFKKKYENNEIQEGFTW